MGTQTELDSPESAAAKEFSFLQTKEIFWFFFSRAFLFYDREIELISFKKRYIYKERVYTEREEKLRFYVSPKTIHYVPIRRKLLSKESLLRIGDSWCGCWVRERLSET